jgi:hypothetical protein
MMVDDDDDDCDDDDVNYYDGDDNCDGNDDDDYINNNDCDADDGLSIFINPYIHTSNHQAYILSTTLSGTAVAINQSIKYAQIGCR